MTEVKTGDSVRIHYTGTLKDGTTFDSSEGREPLSFEVGSGQIIPGLDTALPGMTVGETKKVDVPCDQAYGPADPAMRQAIPRDTVPENIPLEPGTRLQMQTAEGEVTPVTVLEANDTQVLLDANHPLAGQDLVFDIKVVDIEKAA